MRVLRSEIWSMIPHIYHRAPSTARVDDGSAPITTSLGRRPKRAAPSQHLLDRLTRAEDHPVLHLDHALTLVQLDHLRIEQPRQGPPARLGCWALGPLTLWLVPHAEMAQDGGQVALKP